MRSTLLAVGAFLFLAYPLFLLFAVANRIDTAEHQPHTAAISASGGDDRAPSGGSISSYGQLRNTTLRRGQ